MRHAHEHPEREHAMTEAERRASMSDPLQRADEYRKRAKEQAMFRTGEGVAGGIAQAIQQIRREAPEPVSPDVRRRYKGAL